MITVGSKVATDVDPRLADLLGERRDAALLAEYLALDGVMSADDLVIVARLLMDQPLSWVARQIVDRQILTFTFGGRVFAPRFQFGTHPLQVLLPVREAMQELASVRDGNSLAGWFVESNCWLGQRRPCAVLPLHPQQVLAAARGDRRIASGW